MKNDQVQEKTRVVHCPVCNNMQEWALEEDPKTKEIHVFCRNCDHLMGLLS